VNARYVGSSIIRIWIQIATDSTHTGPRRSGRAERDRPKRSHRTERFRFRTVANGSCVTTPERIHVITSPPERIAMSSSLRFLAIAEARSLDRETRGREQRGSRRYGRPNICSGQARRFARPSAEGFLAESHSYRQSHWAEGTWISDLRSCALRCTGAQLRRPRPASRPACASAGC
jgi:hypothetical protein